MDTLVVALVVAAAAFYTGRRIWRAYAMARKKDAGACGGGCCAPKE